MLRGRPLDDIVDQLPTLWEVLFRVRDDIKVCRSLLCHPFFVSFLLLAI